MVSRVQEGDDRHQRFLHRTANFKAVILVCVLLLSAPVISIAGSIRTDFKPVAGDPARTAGIIYDNATFAASPSSIYAGGTITFYANASSDIVGTNLTFTIFYDYIDNPNPTVNLESPVTVNTTGNPGSVVQTHTYDLPATNFTTPYPRYYVYLFVADESGDNFTMFLTVGVRSPPVNMPPRFIVTPGDPLPLNAQADVTQNISITIADPDNDTVTVFWDFGDGTNSTNVTVALWNGTVLNLSHKWIPPRIPGKGNYNATYLLNVSLSDGHNLLVNSSTTVNVKIPFNWPPGSLRVAASQLSASPLELVTFTANASDPEGDPLTWTFNYSDGTVEVHHTGFTSPSLLVWQNSTHAFATLGNHTVNVSVSDALVPFQTGMHNITVQTTVQVVTNVAPSTGTTIDVNPGAPQINATRGYVNATVSIEAFDLDGDMFNLTWDLGVFGIRTNVSVGDNLQRKSPFRYSQILTFTETGTYPVTVTLTDGRPGHEVQRTTVVNVSSNNLPPSVLEFNHEPYSLGDFAAANESVKFRLVITDRERDAIALTWDFGDGSPTLFMNRTDYDAKGNITILVNHTYVLKGYYNLTVVLTDNKLGFFNHTLTYEVPIQVSVRPPVVTTNWDWWDYTSLALFMMIPISAFAWYAFLRRQRRQIEDQGMSYDEWKIKKEMDSKELSK